jgi:hypothetical protein
MQGHTGDRSHGGVEDPAGKRLAQRILAALLPTRHQVKPLVELGQKARNLYGVVLEIRVHGKDQIT